MFPYLEHNHQEDGLQNHRAPLYPSLSILTTRLQSPNHNATLHWGSQPSSLWEYWKTGPALKSQHIIFPQGYFFKLVHQRASLQQHRQGQTQMSEKQIPAVISAMMIPLMESLSETCFHHKKITVGTHWLWCTFTPTQFHQGTPCPLQNLKHKSHWLEPKCVNFSEVLVEVLL